MCTLNKKYLTSCVYLVFFAFSFFYGHAQQSKLPKAMPAKVEIGYDENGGMSPYFKHISIVQDSLHVKERSLEHPTAVDYAVKIDMIETKNIYQTFVANKFDRIKNNKPKFITYDASSTGITLIVNDKITYQKNSGMNSPMNTIDLKRYMVIRETILNLYKKYRAE